MSDLLLDRPLAVFDIESTGTNVRADRIIDLAIVKLLPGGGREEHRFRVNPTVPIPPEVSRIHGIRDGDVKDCPPFPAVAGAVRDALAGCDLAGYNALRFDIPMLVEEFKRAGVEFPLEGRRIVDPQRIYHRREPRDLAAALAFYAGESHGGAHDAFEDVRATIKVLEGQLRRYPDLPRDVASLDAYCSLSHPGWADRQGRLKWVNGELTINFGRKHYGRLLREVLAEDPGFPRWMVRGDFPDDTKTIVLAALDGRWPQPPPTAGAEE